MGRLNNTVYSFGKKKRNLKEINKIGLYAMHEICTSDRK